MKNPGKFIVANGTLKTMETFAGTVKTAMEAVYPDCTVKVMETVKNNGMKLTGISIMEKGCNAAPVIYLNDCFEAYRDGCSLNEICQTVKDVYEKNKVQHGLPTDIITDFGFARDRICYKLVNAERNKEMLKDMPHIPFHDLAITFYVMMAVIEENGNGTATVRINNGLMDTWGINDVQELYTLAHENTQRISKGCVAPILDVLKAELESEYAIDSASMAITPLYIATNEQMVNGACVILYDGLLQEFARNTGGSFYIIPSSIHEVLFVPAYIENDAEALQAMTRDINISVLSPDEVLSNNIYFYDADTGSIEMC